MSDETPHSHETQSSVLSPEGRGVMSAVPAAIPAATTGRVKLDDEIADVRVLDAIRIGPAVVRAFEAGPDGLEFLVFGRHHEGDGETVDDAWAQ
jgi:hypothetical protein